MNPLNRALRLLLALALCAPGPALSEEVAQAVVPGQGVAPRVGSADASPPPEDDLLAPVRMALAEGTAVPVVPFVVKSPQWKLNVLAAKVVAGCKDPCETAEAVLKYKERIKLAARSLKL